MKAIAPEVFPWKDYRRYTYPLGLDLGRVAFLSGHTANRFVPETEKIVCEGDAGAQAATALEKIRVILEAGGYGPEDVVSVVQYVPAAAFGALAQIEGVIRERGLAHAPRHVVPVTRLLRRDALVEIEVVAARRASRAREVNGVRLLSGKDSFIVFAGVDDEVSRIEETLRGSGASWAQVVRCRLLVQTEQADALEAASRDMARRVPGLPAIPAVGIAAFPPGSGKAQLCVELVSGDRAHEGFAAAGGLVGRAGPLFVATGLQAEKGETIVEQAENLYGEVVPRLLRSAGIAMEAIVQTVEWLPASALADYKNTGPVRRNALRAPFPVSSGLVCSVLPAQAKLAVDLIAVERADPLAANAA